jgi:hypothetical protein
MTALPAQANSSKPGRQLLIPWLWFWLIVYLINAPALILGVNNDYLKNLFTNPFSLLGNSAQVDPTIWMDLMELSALVVVFLGVITIMFPRLRALLLERSQHLEPLDLASATPSVQEIQAYILEHLPGAQIRINLNRFDQFAITYPLGYRTYAIAVFGGLVVLWKKDRQAAQAVLLHEIAHCKQGDTLIVGAGSLLQWAINYSPVLLLPILLIQGFGIFNSWSQAGGLRPDIWMSNSVVGQNLRGVLWSYLFDDARILLLEIMYMGWIIVLPVAGIWISELGADRDVAGNLLVSSDISRALQNLQGKNKMLRPLASLSHPPAAWRAWFVRQHESPLTWMIPVLAFPLFYVIKIIFYLITAASAAWIAGVGRASITQLIKTVFKSSVNTYVPIWVGMAAVVLLWPLIAALFDWFFNRHKQPANWSKYHQNLICAGLICGLALAGMGLSSRISISARPFEPQAEFTVGQHFQPGNVVHATGLDVSVLGWKEVSTDNAVFAPKPGNRFVAVEAMLVNTGQAFKAIAALTQMKLQDSQGREYALSVNVNLILKAETPDGRIAPGETLRGIVGYEIPKDASGLSFIFIDDVLDGSERFLVDLGSQPLEVAEPASPSDGIDARQPEERVQIGPVIIPANQVEAFSPSKTFKVSGVILRIDQIAALSPSPVLQPESGSGLLVVDCDLENKSSEPVIFPAFTVMEIKDKNGATYKIDTNVTYLAGERTTNFNIKPGQSVHHRFGYQVPMAAKELFFAFSYERGKVFVKLPIPEWPPYTSSITAVPTSATPVERIEAIYQVPAEWIKLRQKAGLPALTGKFSEDWLQLDTECASGIETSCAMDKDFTEGDIPLSTVEPAPVGK